MSDHTDGLEAAAAGKKRMLEGPGGPQGKCRKHKERCVNPANTSGLVTAPARNPSAAQKPRKAPVLCGAPEGEEQLQSLRAPAAEEQVQRLRR